MQLTIKRMRTTAGHIERFRAVYLHSDPVVLNSASCLRPLCLASCPKFTKFLKRDYGTWAKGDDNRAAVVADGESLIESEI